MGTWVLINARWYNLMFEFFASSIFNHGEVNVYFYCLILSVEFFVIIYILGLYLRLGRGPALVAAWGLSLVTFPLVGNELMYPVMASPPVFSTVVQTILVAILFWQIGRVGLLVSTVCLIAAMFLLSYAIITTPTFFLLSIPALCLFVLCGLCSVNNRRELVGKLSAIAFAFIFLIATGIVPFWLGIFQYTAAAMFGLSNTWSGNFDFISILFHFNSYGVSGTFLALSGIAGTAYFARRGSDQTRAVAIGVLVMLLIILAIGIVARAIDFYKGPMPVYFEFFLWPFYAVYGAAFLILIGKKAVQKIKRIAGFLPGGWGANGIDRSLHIATKFLFIIPWLIFIPAHLSSARVVNLPPYPPLMTPIITELKREIGLSPGDVFRGRVATFTGRVLDKPIGWLDIWTLDYSRGLFVGNPHRLVGLWYYDIPTLFEYSELISPPYHLLTRELLARPEDKQMRDVMTLRKIEPRILGMLGVRYIITDALIDKNEHTNLRLRLPIPVNQAYLAYYPTDKNPTLYLYELKDGNIGDYSPTKTALASDATTILGLLSKDDFSPKTTVVVDKPLPEGLVPALSSQLFVERNGLRISAKSNGTSILLLPLAFSRCLEVESTHTNIPQPEIFRANLLETGILFTGQLDATITYFTGPLHNSHCRIEDSRDAEKLNLSINKGEKWAARLLRNVVGMF